MAICTICQGEMKESVSCIYAEMMIGGRCLAPTLWGEEVESKKQIIDFPCRDCGTPPSGVHHPGCFVARCPGCFGRAWGCHCSSDPDDDLDLTIPEDMATFRQRYPFLARPQFRCRAHLLPRYFRS